MKDKVQAGLISDVKDLLKKALSSVFNLVDKVADSIGWEAEGEAKEVTEAGKRGMQTVYSLGENEGKATVTVFTIDGSEDKVDIKISIDGKLGDKVVKESKEFKNKPKSDVDKIVKQFADDNGFTVEASSAVRITLQRVTAGNESTINLTAICADEYVSNLMNVVDQLVANDDFVSNICEKPTTFAIKEDEDSFDVQEQAEPISCCDVLLKLIFKQQALLNSLKTIHWGAKGEDFFTLHNHVESLYNSIMWHLDTMGEYMVEKFDTIPDLNGGCYCKHVQETSNGFDLRQGFEALNDLMEKYICELECFHMVAEHDMQSILDNFIRDMKKEKDYFVKRTLE